MDFSKLKKRNSLQELTKKVESMQKKDYSDERVWKPAMNKTTNDGYAVIRFLPAKDETIGDFVRQYSYRFRGVNGWYNELSPHNCDLPDPVAEANKKLYDSGIEANKKIASRRKRQTKYYANVYVVKDRENPENEGKVFLYEFGTQIFQKIEKALKPQFEDDAPIDPFDMWGGANFKIKIVGKKIPDRNNPSKEVVVPNYEESLFDAPSELFPGDDAKKEEVWKQAYSLEEFHVTPEKLKTYEELQARFLKVTDGSEPMTTASDLVGGDAPVASAPTTGVAEAKSAPSVESQPAVATETETTSAPVAQAASAPVSSSPDEQNAMAFFDNLSNGNV